jgi:hypothetical protein
MTGIIMGITFPVVVPFDIPIHPVLPSTRTGGHVFIAGITLGVTFQVLIPFQTLVDPVLTSRELAVRFSGRVSLLVVPIIGFFHFREPGVKLVKVLLKTSENRPTTLVWSLFCM